MLRGCGTRESGGLYLSTQLSPVGKPVWSFLIDPPWPWERGEFQGVIVAPQQPQGWEGTDRVLLLDMVSKHDYPTVACFVEEVRRLGLSRRIPVTFDWELLHGKQVYLGTLHWRARRIWEVEPDFFCWYEYCQHEGDLVHFHQDCVFHSWSQCHLHHDVSDERDMQVTMPAFSFSPAHVLRYDGPPKPPHDWMLALPDGEYLPGIFAAWPVDGIEAIDYIPEGCNVLDSGLSTRIVHDDDDAGLWS